MRPERSVLAFDTSGPYCAAALLVGEDVVACRVDDMARGQAEHLMDMLGALLADHGLAWRDLSALGVGTGPGNFTGIRISVAAARGLSLGLGVPAVGVSVPEAIGAGQGRAAVVMSAPRGQVYLHLQEMDLPGVPEGKTRLHSANELPDMAGYEGADLLCWPEAGLVGELPERFTQPLHPASAPSRGDMVARIARLALARHAGPALPRPVPLYIRPADAAPSSQPAPVLLD